MRRELAKDHQRRRLSSRPTQPQLTFARTI
jgi:hypothetical protein